MFLWFFQTVLLCIFVLNLLYLLQIEPCYLLSVSEEVWNWTMVPCAQETWYLEEKGLWAFSVSGDFLETRGNTFYSKHELLSSCIMGIWSSSEFWSSFKNEILKILKLCKFSHLWLFQYSYSSAFQFLKLGCISNSISWQLPYLVLQCSSQLYSLCHWGPHSLSNKLKYRMCIQCVLRHGSMYICAT